MLLVNGGQSTLATTITNSGTTISVATGDGAKFPSGDFTITIDDGTHQEVVYVPAGGRSGDTFSSCVRAYEAYAGAATAWAFTAGPATLIAQTVTASTLNRLVAGSKLLLDYAASTDIFNATTISNGVWTDVVSQAFTVDDANALIEAEVNGFIRMGGTTACEVSSRLMLDGATTKRLGGSHTLATYTNALAGSGSISFGALGVGSHTLKLQILTDGGNNNAWLLAATGNSESLNMRVWQRPQATTTLSPVVANGAKVLLDFTPTSNQGSDPTALSQNVWTDFGPTESFTVDDPNAIVRLSISGNVLINQNAGARIVLDPSGANLTKQISGSSGGGAWGNVLAGAMPWDLVGLSVGVHTFKLQVNSYPAAASAYCRIATEPPVYTLRYIVEQIPQVQSTPVGGTAGDKLLLNYSLGSDITGITPTLATWTNFGSQQTFVVDDPSANIEVEVGGFVRSTGAVNALVAVAILIDGATRYSVSGNHHPVNLAANVLAGSTPTPVGSLSIGSHTFQLQVRSDAAQATIECLAGTQPTETLFLRVWQRPTIYRGASVPGAQYSRSTTQTLTGSLAAISLDTKGWDSDSMWAVGNPTRLTVHTAGKYVAMGSASTSVGGAGIAFGKNGVATYYGSQYAPTGIDAVASSHVFDLAVGDYIELFMINSGGGTTVANAVFFTLERIGDAAFGGPIKFAEVVLTGAQASVPLPASGSLPQNYRNIRITLQAASDQPSDQAIYMRLNGDSATNYEHEELFVSGASVAGTLRTAQAQFQIGSTPGTSRTAGEAGESEVLIWNYSGTVFRKGYQSRETIAGANQFVMVHGGRWANTAAVTSVTLLPQAGSFVPGSVFSLYLDP